MSALHVGCLQIVVRIHMCVGATKGTYRRDIKMIVNHDYIKQCIIFAKKKKLADYTSKYCLLSIQLTSACIYTPQHTNFGCFVRACCYIRIFCLTLYDSAGLLKPPLRNFAITHLILGLHYCALVTFPIKLFHTVLRKKF